MEKLPKTRSEIYNNDSLSNCIDLFFEMNYIFSDLKNMFRKTLDMDLDEFMILFFIFHNSEVLSLRDLRNLVSVKSHKNIQYKILKLKEKGLIFAKDEEIILTNDNLKCNKFREVYDLTNGGFEMLARGMFIVVESFQDLTNLEVTTLREKINKVFVPIKINYLNEE